MSWAAARKRTKQSNAGGGGLFVRLKDEGDSVRFAPAGIPHERWKKWAGGKPIDCTPDDPDAKCEMMLAIYDVDAEKERVLSLPDYHFDGICDLVEKHGEEIVIAVTRLGTGKATRYSARKVGSATSDKVRQGVDDAARIDLTEFGGTPCQLDDDTRSQPTQTADAEPELDDDVPF